MGPRTWGRVLARVTGYSGNSLSLIISLSYVAACREPNYTRGCPYLERFLDHLFHRIHIRILPALIYLHGTKIKMPAVGNSLTPASRLPWATRGAIAPAPPTPKP
jgi:hypothetical protein